MPPDAAAAVAELGYDGPQADHLVVVENERRKELKDGTVIARRKAEHALLHDPQERAKLEADPNVQALKDMFGAELKTDSIEILDNSQKFIEEKYNTGKNPVDFVFHGGSGSSLEEIREAIGYGVIKMNIDTDLQYAYMAGVRDYMADKTDYLQGQIGNPEGDDSPNKKYYDPRKWVRLGEESFKDRLKQAFEDLNNVNTL